MCKFKKRLISMMLLFSTIFYCFGGVAAYAACNDNEGVTYETERTDSTITVSQFINGKLNLKSILNIATGEVKEFKNGQLINITNTSKFKSNKPFTPNRNTSVFPSAVVPGGGGDSDGYRFIEGHSRYGYYGSLYRTELQEISREYIDEWVFPEGTAVTTVISTIAAVVTGGLTAAVGAMIGGLLIGLGYDYISDNFTVQVSVATMRADYKVKADGNLAYETYRDDYYLIGYDPINQRESLEEYRTGVGGYSGSNYDMINTGLLEYNYNNGN